MKSEESVLIPNLESHSAERSASQRMVMNLWCGPIAKNLTPRAQCRKNYEKSNQKLIELVLKTPPEKRTKQVLIEPLQGLENSFRNWSLNQILEHLLIVSKKIEALILNLSSGVPVEGKAELSKVALSGEDRDFLPEFMAYAPGLMKRLDERLALPGMNLDSKLKYHHFWFGECTARQWYWLLSMKQINHFRQAKKIAQCLKDHSE